MKLKDLDHLIEKDCSVKILSKNEKVWIQSDMTHLVLAMAVQELFWDTGDYWSSN